MTAPVLLTAGDSTPGRLRVVEINMTSPLNTVSPNWQPVQYIESTNFNPDDNAEMQDAQVSGDGGWKNQDKLGAGWTLEMVLNHMSVPGSNPPAYHPTHDYLENRAIGSFGAANRIQVRVYDYDVNDTAGTVTPRGQAYTGFASYTWPAYGSTGNMDARKVTVTMTGKGRLVKIAHPYPLTGTVPTVSAISPATFKAAGGGLVTITGSGFATTIAVTGVKIGTVNATQWNVNSDSEIVAQVPAQSAGTTGNVIVTNATGPSAAGTGNAFTYTA